MKSKRLLIMVVLSFLLLVALGMRFNAFVHANPVTPLLMPKEYINATISQINGVPWAAVDGEYLFEDSVYVSWTMVYPVPPGSPAEKISVKMNDTSLSWSYCEPSRIYPTVVGDFPMIQWNTIPIQDFDAHNFTIKTHYEHPLSLINGSYGFLYPSGTGSWNTTAYFKIYISYDVAPEEDYINVYTIANVNGNWIWKPANYVITPEAGKWKVNLTLVSEPFKPLEEDTLVTIHPLKEEHDVAVTRVTPSRTTIYKGQVATITVVAENQGHFTETFNVTAYYNNTAIGTKTATLLSLENIILVFDWNTIGVAKGKYLISATATQVQNETETADNTKTDGWVLVRKLGDVDGDRRVGIGDVILVLLNWGPVPPKDPTYDVDGDGVVGIGDVIIVFLNWG